MNISDRLRQTLDKKEWSIKKLSDVCDIPYRTTQDYLHGKTSPGAEALRKLCRGLEVSADWLLFGEGEVEPEESRSVGEVMEDWEAGRPVSAEERRIMMDTERRGRALRRLSSLPAIRQADKNSKVSDLGITVSQLVQLEDSEAGQLLTELNLGERSLMARRSSQGSEWRLLAALVEALPSPMSLEGLAQTLGLEAARLGPDLRILQRQGVVEEVSHDGGVGYRAAHPWAELKAESWPDKAELAMEAVRLLMGQIVPVAEASPQAGSVVAARVRVPRAKAQSTLKSLRAAVRSALQEAAGEDDGEEISVVLGLAITSEIAD